MSHGFSGEKKGREGMSHAISREVETGIGIHPDCWKEYKRQFFCKSSSHQVKMPSHQDTKEFTKKFNKRAKSFFPKPCKGFDPRHSFQILYKKCLHECHIENCLCRQKANQSIPPEIAESLCNCSSAHHKKCQIVHG